MKYLNIRESTQVKDIIKRSKSPHMLESELKRRGTKLLEQWGWMVIHLIQTNCNGICDTLCLRSGEAVFIEWKQPGQKPRELQQYRIRKLREQGFQTLVVTDLKELEKLR